MPLPLHPTASQLCLPLPYQKEALRAPKLRHVPHQHCVALSLIELAELVYVGRLRIR
jgi:hypothetical protein